MKAIRTILACIRKADNEYNLINHGDKIVIGLSGGKDSLTLLYALSLYQKFSHTDFIIQPVTLDLGFDNFDPTPLKQFCNKLGYNLIVSDNKEVYKILKMNQNDKTHLPCSICSRMKKAAINKVANELGFNKVAFAHHGDDAIETLFMNMIFGSRLATFSPKMKLEKADITFIRPLILCKEKDIKAFIKEEDIYVSPSSCPADKHTTREEIKTLLSTLYKTYPSSKAGFLNMLSNYSKEDLWGNEIELHISQDDLYLKPVLTKEETKQMLKIRYEVFVKELNISYEDEFNDDENNIYYEYLIYLKDKTIGTIRYIELENRTYKIERFALLKQYRNKGYGLSVLNYLSNLLKERFNPCTIVIHSLKEVVPFYLKAGYQIKEVVPFLEAGLPHLYLEKKY